MNVALRIIGFLSVLMWFSSAQAVIINGPILTNNNLGWQENGLIITALQDTTLTSFIYNNQGKADTIRLTDTSGTILQTYNMAAGSTAQILNVSWSLLSSTSYYLIAEQNFGDNGRWEDFTSFPVSNADISVTGWVSNVFGTKGTGTQYWFHFTEITTADNGDNGGGGEVPVPASIALFALGLVCMRCIRRSKA